MSSSSVSGLRAGGSAEASGGSINVGSASSDVNSVLNPIQMSTGVTGDLFVAGDRQLWVPTLLLQRDLPKVGAVNPTKSITRGDIDPALKDMLIRAATAESAKDLTLVDLVPIVNTVDLSKSYTKVQLSKNYDQLQQHITAKDSNNIPSTNGLHIISFSIQPESAAQLLSTRDLQLKALDKSVSPAAKVWPSGQSDKAIDAKIKYLGHSSAEANQNKVEISNVQGSGSTQTHSRFSILGFSTNLNPNDGKTSQLSAFASNNSTVGSIRAIPNQTLEDIAAKYGTTIEALRQVNNLPDPIGSILAKPNQTLEDIAAKYGTTIEALRQVNNLPDPIGSILAKPNQTLEDIAAKYGTTIEALRQVNNFPDPIGSILAKPNQTLEDIAAKYGITVEALRLANNLPDAGIDIAGLNIVIPPIDIAGLNIAIPPIDIAGLNIVIPADLSTVGLYDVLAGDTPTTVAARYGISVSWLMDLNGLTDPGLVFDAAKKLQIPGLKPIGSVALPPAKPLDAVLEYADYGAYTSHSVTYYVEGALTPLFEKNFFDTLR
jgi:LysM repeat protein